MSRKTLTLPNNEVEFVNLDAVLLVQFYNDDIFCYDFDQCDCIDKLDFGKCNCKKKYKRMLLTQCCVKNVQDVEKQFFEDVVQMLYCPTDLKKHLEMYGELCLEESLPEEKEEEIYLLENDTPAVADSVTVDGIFVIQDVC